MEDLKLELHYQPKYVEMQGVATIVTSEGKIVSTQVVISKFKYDEKGNLIPLEEE